jgi:hypothetical protein
MFKKRKAVDNFNNKQHLTPYLVPVTIRRVNKFLRIRASINKGLSETLSVNLPNTIPAVKLCVDPISIQDPNLLTGFPSADVCF